MLLFLLKFTLATAAFALVYLGLLRAETFLRANRLYLLATLWLALGYGMWAGNVVAPLENAPASHSVEAATRPAAAGWFPTIDLVPWERRLSFGTVAGWLRLVWIAGALLALARLCWGLARLYGLIPGLPFDRLPDGSLLVRSGAVQAPFSFFHWIFVPIHFDPAGADAAPILVHERAHAGFGHSTDVIFTEALCIAFWFHPLAYWYRRALRLVHEYQADAAVAADFGRKSYGEMLLRQAVLAGPPGASAFGQGSLKQRIDMLTRPASALRRAWGYAAGLAIVLLLVALEWQSLSPLQHGERALDHRPLELYEAWYAACFSPAATSSAPADSLLRVPCQDARGSWFHRQADVMPLCPEGWQTLLDANARAVSMHATRERLPAVVFARCVIERDGSLSGIRALSPSDYHFAGYDQWQRAAERLLAEMPRWQPARLGADTVRCEVLVKIGFGF